MEEINFCRYGKLEAVGIVTKSHIERVLKSAPTEFPLGVIAVRNLVSALYVNPVRTVFNKSLSLSPGTYESHDQETGLFLVRSINRNLRLDLCRGTSDTLSATGIFRHIKPSGYAQVIPPGVSEEGDAVYREARLTIDDYSSLSPVCARILVELGEEEY